jgi:hypothetical protein
MHILALALQSNNRQADARRIATALSGNFIHGAE